MIKALIIIVTGAGMYLLFRGLRVALFKSGVSRQKRFAVTLSVIEFVLWTLFVFWAVDQLFENKTYYTYLSISMVLVLMLFIVWFYIKDLVAGVLFKIQHNPKEGQYFRCVEEDGTVRKVTTTHLFLENDQGQVVKIPFSTLQGNIVKQGSQKDHAGDVRMKVRVTSRVPTDEVMYTIRELILLYPFSSFKKPIDIRPLTEADGKMEYEISFTSIRSGPMNNLEARITAAFAGR